MKSIFLFAKSKSGFTFIEVIISVSLISILLLSILTLKDSFLFRDNKNEEKRTLLETAIFIESKIKNINSYKTMDFKNRYGQKQNFIVFKNDNNYDSNSMINYFFFELDSGKLLYRAYNSYKESNRLNYRSFSNSNYINENIKEFDLLIDEGLFKFKIKDNIGNELEREVLIGVLNE